MKYARKLPKGSREREKELLSNGWKKLKEPNSLIKIILSSIPFMILNAIITILLIKLVSSISFKNFGINDEGFKITLNLFHILGLILMTFIHELIHLVFVPNFKKSDKTYLGLTFFGGFVHTEEEIQRNRFFIISLAPYIIISVILPIILGLFGLLTTWLKIYMIINAMGASVDVLNIFIIYFQVPPRALLTNNGIKTYWKKYQ